MAKLSVILPFYNASNYLERAVESIRSQTYTDFELLLIDDGSTDEGLQWLEHLNDARIQLYRNDSNLGIVASLNRGMQLASGDFIARMDADDISLPQRFQEQLSFLENHADIGLCGTAYRLLGTSDTIELPLQPDLVKCTLLFHCCVAHPTVMLRRSAILHDLSQLYDSSYRHAEDYELWVRLSSSVRIANLAQPLLLYRRHNQQISSQHAELQLQQANRIRRMQLLALGIEPTAQQWQLHLDLCSNRTAEKEAKLQWFHTLLVYNKRARIYNHDALMHQLSLLGG